MLARSLPILLLAPALLAQAPPPRDPVPDDILFHFFFLRLAAGESNARAQGKGDSLIKRALFDKARLTSTEFSLLKEVAVSCNDAYDAKTRSGFAEVLELAAQKPAQGAPPPQAIARIEALERDRAQVIHGCLDSLRRGMGPAGFAKLEAHVRQVEGPRVRYLDGVPGPDARPVPVPQITPTPTGGDPRQGGLQ